MLNEKKKEFSVLISIILFLFIQEGIAKKKIVMSTYLPMVICDQEKKIYTGIDIDIFNELIPLMNWQKSDFEYICYKDYKDMIRDALNPMNEIFIAMGGISISNTFLEQGAKFTTSYFSNKLNVISKVKPTNIIFTLAELFALDFILTFIFSTIVMGFLIYWLEKKRTPIQEIFVHLYNHLLNFDNIRILNYEVKIIDVMHYIFSYVIVIVLIASLINNLYASAQDGKNNKEGKKFVTFSEYAKYLEMYKSISIIDESIGNYNDVDNWLLSNEVDGVVIDSTLNNLVSYIFCDNYISISEIAVIFFGFMLNSKFDNQELTKMNTFLLDLNKKQKYQERYMNFIENFYSDLKCTDRIQLITDGTIGLSSIKELWYILLIGLGISIFNFAIIIYKKYKINQNYGRVEIQKSRVIQTWESRNFKEQQSLAAGLKRLSAFQEFKKKNTVYLNHDPRALMDSQVTYHLCQLLVKHLKIFQHISLNDREIQKKWGSRFTLKANKSYTDLDKKSHESHRNLDEESNQSIEKIEVRKENKKKEFYPLKKKMTFFSTEEIKPHFFDIIKKLKKNFSNNPEKLTNLWVRLNLNED